MARVLVIFAHPAFERSRVNRALVAAALAAEAERYQAWLGAMRDGAAPLWLPTL